MGCCGRFRAGRSPEGCRLVGDSGCRRGRQEILDRSQHRRMAARPVAEGPHRIPYVPAYAEARRALRRGRVRRPIAGGARQRRDRLRQGHVRLFLLPEHARADAPEPLLRPPGGAGGGAAEAEDLGPGLLHADLESRARRAASRMAGRPQARRQVPPQARGDLRGAEGVHEYLEARRPPPRQGRPAQACRAARRRQGISALPVAVLHRPGGVPEGGTRPHPGACLQVRAGRRLARRRRLSRPAIATNACGSCGRRASIHSMRACSMPTRRSFASHFSSAFTR